jgi:hypothetical protein
VWQLEACGRQPWRAAERPGWEVLMMGYPVSNKSQGIVGEYRVICMKNGHGCW